MFFAVSKRWIKVLNALAYLACVCGLIWQITQISMNFFKYESVSETTITMPMMDYFTVPKLWDICFDAINIGNDTEINNLYKLYPEATHNSDLLNRLPVRARFKMAAKPNDVFKFVVPSPVIRYIGRVDMTCYRITRVLPSMRYVISNRYWKRISQMRMATNLATSPIYIDLLSAVPITGNTKNHTVARISSNTFTVIKLPHPYSEDCFDYKSIGYGSKYEALAECTMAAAVKESNQVYGFVSEKETMYENLTFTQDWKFRTKCFKLFSKEDCSHDTIFTNSDTNEQPDNDFPSQLDMYPDVARQPSFKIESKPKMDKIDYFTFAFGAFGTWLGICFLSLNPVPYLFKAKELPQEQNVTPSPYESNRLISVTAFKLNMLNKKFTRELTRINQELINVKSKLD